MPGNSSSPDQVSISMSPAVFQSLVTSAAPAPAPGSDRAPTKVNGDDVVANWEPNGGDFFGLLGDDTLFEKLKSEDAQRVSSGDGNSQFPLEFPPIKLPKGGAAAPSQQLALHRQVVRFHKPCRQAGFYVKGHPDEFPESALSAGQRRQWICPSTVGQA
jgi:hypothetical protein